MIFKKKIKEKKEEEKKNPRVLQKEFICSLCGKPYEYSCTVKIDVDGNKTCVHDEAHTGTKSDITKRRHANEEASVMALRMAAEQKRIDSMQGEDKMVAVKSYQEGKNKGKTMMIPKKAIDSLEEKVKSDEDFQRILEEE